MKRKCCSLWILVRPKRRNSFTSVLFFIPQVGKGNKQAKCWLESIMTCSCLKCQHFSACVLWPSSGPRTVLSGSLWIQACAFAPSWHSPVPSRAYWPSVGLVEVALSFPILSCHDFDSYGYKQKGRGNDFPAPTMTDSWFTPLGSMLVKDRKKKKMKRKLHWLCPVPFLVVRAWGNPLLLCPPSPRCLTVSTVSKCFCFFF